MIEFILGIVISFLLGAATSWYFAKRSSQELQEYVSELQQDNARLKRLSEITLVALENGGMVKLNRDENNNVVGRLIEVGASLETSWNVQAAATDDRPLQGEVSLSGDLSAQVLPSSARTRKSKIYPAVSS